MAKEIWLEGYEMEMDAEQLHGVIAEVSFVPGRWWSDQYSAWTNDDEIRSFVLVSDERYVTADRVSLRKTPGGVVLRRLSMGEKVKTGDLFAGDPLEVRIGCDRVTGRWQRVKVEDGGVFGWVHSSFLREEPVNGSAWKAVVLWALPSEADWRRWNETETWCRAKGVSIGKVSPGDDCVEIGPDPTRPLTTVYEERLAKAFQPGLVMLSLGKEPERVAADEKGFASVEYFCAN